MLGGGLGGGRQAPGPRPQLKMCYLCGQQFGSASIGIHIPQCYAKKVAQWEAGNPSTRGPRPKDPDTVDWKGSKGQNAKKLNDEQFHEFEANLVPCPNCGRTFLPDRLPVHLRGCKGTGGGGPKPGAGSAASSSATSHASTTPARASMAKSTTSNGSGAAGRSPSRGTSPARRPPGGRLVLPTCYLCGQQFGSASIAIHVPQCYVKRLAQWEAGDPATRGKAPRHPDQVNWRLRPDDAAVGGGGMSMEEQCDAQFQEFVNNLEPCPNCNRKFLSDRLIVHLRSCRPGHAAKPVGAPHTQASTTPAGQSSTTAEADAAAESRSPQTSPPPSKSDRAPKKEKDDGGVDDHDRVHPMRNRVPKDSPVKGNGGRTCPHCQSVEHDSTAKYCRECGWNLNSRAMVEPCKRCGETVPDGARFCGTCGDPVNGAVASERVPGHENANAPTVRVTTCPACRAVCDADGNFCDNCGAALGAAEPEGAAAAPSPAPVQRHMFCPECKESVDDLCAVYCEECGGKLQLVERNSGSGAHAKVSAGRAASPSVPEKRGGSDSGSSSSRAATALSKPSSVAKSTAMPSQPSPVVAKPAFVDDGGMEDMDAEEGMERVECPSCGRCFAPNVLERHERICGRQGKQRRVFDMTKQRLTDCDVPVKQSSTTSRRGPGSKAGAGGSGGRVGGSAGAAPKPAGKDWRAESNAFREAMRNARQVDQVIKSGGTAKDLPPPTYSENAHYVACPHCQRRFAPDVAERHIPRCANTMNRPKPPPKRR